MPKVPTQHEFLYVDTPQNYFFEDYKHTTTLSRLQPQLQCFPSGMGLNAGLWLYRLCWHKKRFKMGVVPKRQRQFYQGRYFHDHTPNQIL